ncbi:MAG TPA: LysM peptidoglycan-binding domain-containing protein [Clostridiaceae bacterium]|nr:LysM peptidoglycan-binding domain-containing protein [Clostridiaceae bacterium]
MVIYTVQPGDSVYAISQRYNTSPQDIILQNQLENPDRLVVGQALVIPIDTIRHVVTAGQSLYSLSRGYGVPLNQIIQANPDIANPNMLQIGQVVNIPITEVDKRTIDVNGYAFPNISDITLRSTLPYLTFISIFSYQVRADGSLVTIDDQRVIDTARQYNVAPMMVITNILEGGSFDSDLASTILSSQEVQNNLIQNILNTLQAKNYSGLDIDFEYIYPSDRELYNAFLGRVVGALRPLGYIITTALAPKTSADQQGLLYEAHDYPVHGRLADHVIIMTYEWGYTFGPPMAVSPINEVARVLNYAVTAIPPEKILMGMPNYGYDWTLPYTPGTAARTVTNLGAVNLAADVGARIQYNTTSQAPFFTYYDANGRRHIVWFDDARSINARLGLVNRFGLGGVSYWTINTFFNQQWLVLASMYNINKIL